MQHSHAPCRAVSTFYKYLAVFYVYLLAIARAETVAPEVRSLFGSNPLQFDGAGKPIVQDIIKSTEPRLEVSNFLQNDKGEWHQVRLLGGPMAMKWIEFHGQGHPNTTVRPLQQQLLGSLCSLTPHMCAGPTARTWRGKRLPRSWG